MHDHQLERLCAAVYLDGLLHYPRPDRLGVIADMLLKKRLAGCKKNGVLPCQMTEAEWTRVLKDIRSDPDLSRLRIIKKIDLTEANAESYGALPGHRAFAFVDIKRNAYAIFRGTGGGDEWMDNALGMIQEETAQQKAALRFIMELKEMPSVKTITAAGHSKGGNKAQFVTITAPDGYVRHCFSLDGQGFSRAFLSKYSQVIDKRKGLIHMAAERRDFVNCLGFYLTADTQFYIGRRQNPLPYYHCPDALRDASGNFGAISVMKPLPDMINHWVTYFLSEIKYAALLKTTVTGVISLIVEKKRASDEETAEALVNLIESFMELLRVNETFQNQVRAVFFHESRLLLDTFEAAGYENNNFFALLKSALKDPNDDNGNEKNWAALIIERLAHRMLDNDDIRGDFFFLLSYLGDLIKELKKSSATEYKVYDYIQTLVDNLLKRMAVNAMDKMISLIPSIWKTWRGR